MAVEVIELQDNVSGPARKAGVALRALDKAMANLRKTFEGANALGALAGVFDTVGAAAGRSQAQIKELDAQLKKLKADSAKPVNINVRSSSGGGRGGALGGAVEGESGAELAGAALGKLGLAFGAAQVVKEVVHALEQAVRLAVDLGVLAGKTALEMTNFKTETLRSFAAMTGSRREAEKLFENAKAISRLTGQAPEHVVDQMRKLIADGFSPKGADKILHAVADVAAVRGEAAGDKLATIIDTIKNKGALDKGAVRQLAKIGVDTETVYKKLAEKTHKSLDQVKADLKAGKIEADVASAAIAAAAEQKFGGAAKSKADSDIFILLARAKNAIKGLFEDVDIGPVRGALQNAVHFLEGPGGTQLKGAIGGTVGALLHTVFDPFSGPGGAQKFQDFGHTLIDILGAVTAALKAAGPAVGFFVDMLASLGKKDAKGTTGLDQITRSLRALWEVMKLFVGLGDRNDVFQAVKELAGLGKGSRKGADVSIPQKAGLGDLLGGSKDAIGVGAIAPAQGAASEPVGAAMTNGVTAGIEGGKSGIVDAMVSACTAAVDAANSALDIHSPSKVFAKIGGFTAQGFAQGIAGDSSPSAAAAGMASIASGAAASAPSMAGGGAGGGGGHTFNVTIPGFQVHAKDAAGGQAAGEAASEPLANAIRDGITRAVREMREAG